MTYVLLHASKKFKQTLTVNDW